ncbi:hypothetical protein NE865_03403 [Phthorimaea operculella]|nr:hypothetical protein NE865_03403 [Phthorimaea operculella]
MSGFNPYGNPQYPPPQNQNIYPHLPPQQGQPGFPGAPGNPQFPYQQPGMPNYNYSGQPQPGNPAAMSYANVNPSAPPPGPGFGFPSVTPQGQQGYPNATPQGYPNVTPQGQGYPNVTPTGYPNAAPQGFPTVTPTAVVAVDWVPSSPQSAASLTDKAVVAGYEGHDGSPLWVIRSRYQGDLIPGKLAVKHHAAYVPWGGDENSVQSFEVCCARPESIRWVECRDGAVPPKAVPAGHTSEGETLYVGRAKQGGSLTPGKICLASGKWDGAVAAGHTSAEETLYVGRAKQGGSLTPGKVHPSHKAMYISFAGKEHPHKVYEVLCTV